MMMRRREEVRDIASLNNDLVIIITGIFLADQFAIIIS